MELRTTHVVTSNAGNSSFAIDTPAPPDGHICVIDWINWDWTTSVATGLVRIGIRRTNSTQVVFQQTYAVQTVGESGSLFFVFEKGFPCHDPSHASGTTGTLSDVNAAAFQMEVYGNTSGVTMSNQCFSFAYHFEPRVWRAAGQ